VSQVRILPGALTVDAGQGLFCRCGRSEACDLCAINANIHQRSPALSLVSVNEDDRREVEQLLADSDRSAGVVFLPASLDEDGKGVYDDALTFLSKVLRAEGVEVSWAQEPDQRTYEARRSAAEVIWTAVLSFPFTVAGGVAVAKLVQWLGLSAQRENWFRFYVVQAKVPDGTSWEWRVIEGTGGQLTGGELAQLAESIQGLASPAPELPTPPEQQALTSDPPTPPPSEPPLVPPN
jgi:hypothetical protein